MDSFTTGSYENQNGSSAATMIPLDPEELRRQGHIMVDLIADYYKKIEKYPVQSKVEPGYLRQRLPTSAPYLPETMETILKDIQEHIVPGLTHWQSPGHFAYYPNNTSTAGFLGEMLCTGFNVNGFSWIMSPAVTELENITMDQTHSALEKAANIAGINPNNIRSIPTTKSTAYSLTPSSLQEQIAKDVELGLVPLFLCATVGTTSTSAVDPLGPICNITENYGIWVHVDAAYAGSACICPEFRHLIDGVEGANSFSFNAHKCLFSSIDCCCLWLKNPSALVKALSAEFECLRYEAKDPSEFRVNYKDWQIALTRWFRYLKLWMVLRYYGVSNLRAFVRNHVNLARRFEELVVMDKRFEVVVPVEFSMVCFRVSPSAFGREDLLTRGFVNKFNSDLLETVNGTGRVCMTHAVVGGVYLIRFAVGSSLVEYRHIDMGWKVVQETASSMLKALCDPA